tara:strand:+ start:4367 stop:4807 length:441 start_codon:yes stop_codon:yes gene_type:complete
MPVLFPSLTPSSRSFTPGTYPSTDFESLDGTKTHLRFGNKQVNARLTLGFSNITDDWAARILDNYESANKEWDGVQFAVSEEVNIGLSKTNEAGLKGLAYKISHPPLGDQQNSYLIWRYDGPPEVTSVYPGRSDVQCKFVACLDSP